MKRIIFLAFIFGTFIMSCTCSNNFIEYSTGDIKVSVEQGKNWIHGFPLFMGIELKNSPQIAIWLTDMSGNYLATVYVSKKIASEGWVFNNNNRRRESLPVWCYARNIQYPDGLYLPTKKQPLPDSVTGATPKGSFSVKLAPAEKLKQFKVRVEVNHSRDFNENYPETDAISGATSQGNSSYSAESGQPALVYEASVDLLSGNKKFDAQLIGHSSPDGTSGNIESDTSKITTALDIIKRITVEVN